SQPSPSRYSASTPFFFLYSSAAASPLSKSPAASFDRTTRTKSPGAAVAEAKAKTSQATSKPCFFNFSLPFREAIRSSHAPALGRNKALLPTPPPIPTQTRLPTIAFPVFRAACCSENHRESNQQNWLQTVRRSVSMLNVARRMPTPAPIPSTQFQQLSRA